MRWVKNSGAYIGVTGVDTSANVTMVWDAWVKAWRGGVPSCHLMLGVLVSSKTLYGGTNKYPLRYPKAADVAALLRCSSMATVLPMIHYAGDKSIEHLQTLNEIAGEFCAGVQFNGAWPAVNDLAKFVEAAPGRRIVLQVGPTMLAEHPGAALAWELDQYKDLVTDVLLDASGGKGLPIDAEAAAWPLMFIGDRHPQLGCGIAGGFSGSTLTPTVGKMMRAGCSIDAEGRLRDGTEGGGYLLEPEVRAYLNRAVELRRETS